MMQYTDIYRRTIEKWGEQAQLDQAVEESAELIATLKHYARGKVGRDAVILELADVYLMVGQLIYMFGEKELEEAVEKKIAKLESLLQEGS